LAGPEVVPAGFQMEGFELSSWPGIFSRAWPSQRGIVERLKRARWSAA
jgi:hypothetical protein